MLGSTAPGRLRDGGSGPAQAARKSVWTAYDLGSSGYVEASAIAEAIMKKHPIKVRIVPSGTSIGRLLPLKQGQATYGYLANELYFATEGTVRLRRAGLGPQDVRVVLARPAANGMAIAKDTGVKTIADIKGKRIGYVKGNPSVNVKNEAYLAFAGLTENDIEVGLVRQLRRDEDRHHQQPARRVQLSVTTSANMREIEASPRGLTWPPFPASDKEGWARMHKVARLPGAAAGDAGRRHLAGRRSN